MRPSPIVKVQIAADRGARFAGALAGLQIHLLVFHRFPQPLDEHIIAPRALAVHADRNAVLDQHAGERLAGELRALIRVENPRPAVFRQGLLQRLDAKIRLHADRHAMRQNAPAAQPAIAAR